LKNVNTIIPFEKLCYLSFNSGNSAIKESGILSILLTDGEFCTYLFASSISLKDIKNITAKINLAIKLSTLSINPRPMYTYYTEKLLLTNHPRVSTITIHLILPYSSPY